MPVGETERGIDGGDSNRGALSLFAVMIHALLRELPTRMVSTHFVDDSSRFAVKRFFVRRCARVHTETPRIQM